MKKTMLSFGRIGRRSRLWRGISLALASVMLFCSTFVYLSVKVEAATVGQADMEPGKVYIQNADGTYSDDAITLLVGEKVTAAAIFDNPELGDNEEPYCNENDGQMGSQIWVWDDSGLSDGTMQWKRLDGNKWLGTCEITAKKQTDNVITIHLSYLKEGRDKGQQNWDKEPDGKGTGLEVTVQEVIHNKMYYRVNGGAYALIPDTVLNVNENDQIDVFAVVDGTADEIEETEPEKFDFAEGHNEPLSGGDTFKSPNGDGTITITNSYIVQHEENTDSTRSITLRYDKVFQWQIENGSERVGIYPENRYPTGRVLLIQISNSPTYETNKIYYRVNGQGDFRVNETNTEQRLILMEGDIVEVFVIRQDSGNYGFRVNDNGDPNQKLIRANGPYDDVDEAIHRTDASYTATSNIGNCSIVLYDGNTATEYPQLYISVARKLLSTTISTKDGDRYTYHFYVKTALGEQSKDKVHEFLGSLGIDGTNDGKYVKNDNAYYREGYSCRYWLNPGDETKVVLYVPAGENGEFQSNNLSNLQIEESVWGTAFKSSDGRDYQRVELKLKAGTSTRMSGVTLSYRVDGIVYEEMYFDVIDEDEFTGKWPNFSWANHLDIEVADGGQYIDKTIIYLSDGTRLEIVTEYTVEVGGVNLCTVNYEGGNSVGEGVKTKIDPEEYGWHESGSTAGQTEYTSAYEAEPDNEKAKIYPDHRKKVYNDWRDNGQATKAFVTRNIPRARIASVVFDIKLDLREKKQTITWFKDNASGSLEGTAKGNEYANRYVKMPDFSSVQFTMEGQSLIDALNKCPNHSGLDFTLTKYINQVVTEANLPVQKIFVGGDLSKNHSFQFELLNSNYERFYGDKIIFVAVDEYGAASFDDTHALIDFLNFSESDVGKTFTYYIKEMIPESDASAIVYDNKRIRVDIIVKKVRDEELNIDVLDTDIIFSKERFINKEWMEDSEYMQPNAAQFTNYASYRLPDSGGGGVSMYIFGGGLLMTLAVIFFNLHRRRAVKSFITHHIKYYKN